MLKSKTHNVFGFAIALLLSLRLLKINIVYGVFLSLYFSLIINWAIDYVAGHKGLRRTPYTHSITGTTLISTLSLTPVLVMLQIYGVQSDIWIVLRLLLLSLPVGLSHLLLDMLTADGVYLLWPASRSRIALLRARYDDPLLNTFVSIVSIVIVLSLFLL